MLNLALGEAGVLDRLFEGELATLEQIGRHFLELGPGERLIEVQRAVGRSGDERQVDLRLLHLGQLDFGLLGGFLEALCGHLVGTEIDTVGRLEFGDEPLDDPVVPVVAAEVGVAMGRLDLEHAFADFEHRHVERAATEVEHENRLVLGTLFEAVGERGRGRLVDNTQYFEAGDLTGFLGRGALGVVEVGGHRDDGLGNGVAQVRLGITLELHQRASRDFLRGVLLAVDVFARPRGANVALDRTERAVGVGNRLALGDLANEHFAGFREGDDRRCCATALGVGDDGGVATFKECDHRVGGAEVDADCFSHDCGFSCAKLRVVAASLGRPAVGRNSPLRKHESRTLNFVERDHAHHHAAMTLTSEIAVKSRRPGGVAPVTSNRTTWHATKPATSRSCISGASAKVCVAVATSTPATSRQCQTALVTRRFSMNRSSPLNSSIFEYPGTMPTRATLAGTAKA